MFLAYPLTLWLVISCPCRINCSIMTVYNDRQYPRSPHWVDYYIMSSTLVPSSPMGNSSSLRIYSWYPLSLQFNVLCWVIPCHYPWLGKIISHSTTVPWHVSLSPLSLWVYVNSFVSYSTLKVKVVVLCVSTIIYGSCGSGQTSNSIATTVLSKEQSINRQHW